MAKQSHPNLNIEVEEFNDIVLSISYEKYEKIIFDDYKRKILEFVRLMGERSPDFNEYISRGEPLAYLILVTANSFRNGLDGNSAADLAFKRRPREDIIRFVDCWENAFNTIPKPCVNNSYATIYSVFQALPGLRCAESNRDPAWPR